MHIPNSFISCYYEYKKSGIQRIPLNLCIMTKKVRKRIRLRT